MRPEDIEALANDPELAPYIVKATGNKLKPYNGARITTPERNASIRDSTKLPRKRRRKATQSTATPRLPAHYGTGRPRKERRRDARQAMLPLDRLCPTCGKGPLLLSRQWVVRDGNAVCKACYMKGGSYERTTTT